MRPLPDHLAPEHRSASVALCHGCFDVLHFGHIQHLESAAELADVLVVSVTEDAYVAKPGRPVFTTAERIRVLSALRVVDHVIAVPAVDALPVIEALRPDVYVKGSDYLAERRTASRFDAEQALVLGYGGRVAHTSGDAFSTTAVVDRLLGDPRQLG